MAAMQPSPVESSVAQASRMAIPDILTRSILHVMAHTIRDKKKLIDRVRRIRGQVDGIEKAVLDENDCSAILQTIAACRGAINGLMAEVMEGHVRFHVVNPDHRPGSSQAKAAQELIDVIKTYLR